MPEHIEHRGRNFHTGFQNQRIAVVGYSHWLGDGGTDDEHLTENTVKAVINGKWSRIQFFNAIRSYFSEEPPSIFWDKVIFFNFLPSAIGSESNRYDEGTHEQHLLGRERFERILLTYNLHKVFFFSKKAYWSLTDLPGEELDFDFKSKVYISGNNSIKIFFLRHPQYARKITMKAAVQAALSV